MTITLRSTKGEELSWDEVDGNFSDLDTRTKAGWKDLTAAVGGSPLGVVAPTLTAFAPGGWTLRRVTNGGVDNANTVFALTVDAHYESNRDSTPNKAPDFYA